MYQNRFRLGLGPRPLLRELTAFPALNPLAGFKGPTSKGREGKDGRRIGKRTEKKRGEGREEGREGKGERDIGKGGEGAPVLLSLQSTA